MLKRILLGIVLLAALGVAAYFLTNTETRRIRKQLGAIAEAVSKEEGEGNIAMVYKMQVLGNLLADDVAVLRHPEIEHAVAVLVQHGGDRLRALF